jgi:hypothetical protein
LKIAFYFERTVVIDCDLSGHRLIVSAGKVGEIIFTSALLYSDSSTCGGLVDSPGFQGVIA